MCAARDRAHLSRYATGVVPSARSCRAARLSAEQHHETSLGLLPVTRHSLTLCEPASMPEGSSFGRARAGGASSSGVGTIGREPSASRTPATGCPHSFSPVTRHSLTVRAHEHTRGQLVRARARRRRLFKWRRHHRARVTGISRSGHGVPALLHLSCQPPTASMRTPTTAVLPPI